MKHYYLIFLLIFYAEAKGTSTIRISETFKDTPLKEVLTILNQKYDLKIAYSDHAVDQNLISVRLVDRTIADAFKMILVSTPLTFEQLDEDVIIIKKKQKNENNSHKNYSIIGVVQDRESKERLPYAYVWLKSESKNILTNTDGYFSLSIPSLPAEIMISYLGYQDTSIVINETMAYKRLYVNLTSNPMQLTEVVISGNNINDFETEGTTGKIDFNPKVSYSVPSAGEIDLMRTIQLLPGINATNEFSSGLSIQGGNTNQNLFLFDGFTIYHTDHFFGYFSAINPRAIKSVQLYKSGYDARYGGRTSGVVDISGKEGNLIKTSGSLGINLLSVNTSLEIPLKKNISSLFFSGRRSYTDIISTSLFEKIFENFSSDFVDEKPLNSNSNGGMGHLGNMQNTTGISTREYNIEPKFYYSDLNLKFSSKVGHKSHISLSFYDSNDILNFKESKVSDISDTLTVSENKIGIVNWGNIGTSFKWSRLWNESHYTNALISYSNYQSDYNESGTTSGSNNAGESIEGSLSFEQANSIDDVTLKLDHEWFLSNDQLIRTGMQLSILGTVYSSKTDDITFVENIEENKSVTTFYGLGMFQPVNRLTLNLGLRANQYSMTGKWYWEPRLSLAYQTTTNLGVKVAYGNYYQFVNQSNTKNALQGSRDFWLLADDKTIPIQEASHITAGIEYHYKDYIFNVEYFNKDFEGLLEYAFSNGGLVTEYDNYENMFFQGSGKANGIEFLLKKSGKSVNAWLGYTYGTVKYTFDELNEGSPYYADHDQRHEINTYCSYKLGKFEFFGTWIYGSGRPYSITNGTVTNQRGLNEFNSHVTILEIDEKNSSRLPAYQRLDIGATYTHFFSEVNMVFALNIFNLYNHQNIIDYNYYQIMGTHSNGHGVSTPIVETNAVTSMGITPNISVTVNF
jgi:hypothetical protein